MSIQREIEYSGQFQKDVKKAQKRHKDMSKLKTLMALLINNNSPLPQIYKDHPLQGNYKGYRDAHQNRSECVPVRSNRSKSSVIL